VVTLVIPTLNRERIIGPCLESITKQDYPNLEIIIVDGGSRDKTIPIALKHTSKIIYEKGSLGKARQSGFEASNGEILGMFDSDIVLPSEDWLFKAVQKFQQNNNIGIVWAANQHAPQNASIVAHCFFNLYRFFLRERIRKGENLLPGGNSLILRKAFEEAGGFDLQLHFGEDLDLTRKIISLGYKMTVMEDPIIHHTMSSFKEFTRKQIWAASSLQMQDRVRRKLVDICMTWTAEKDRNTRGRIVGDAFSKHILISLYGMIQGIAKDKDYSWLLLPLLLSIRLITHSAYFLKSEIIAIYKTLI
jgi:cellulose synthase/poly-beta-1,6-N-acetylglucosamine synthase-like glycosyltransferase